MEDLCTQQIEALEVAVPYCAKISNALGLLKCIMEQKILSIKTV